MPFSGRLLFSRLLAAWMLLYLSLGVSFAQVNPPVKDELFEEDSEREELRRERETKALLQPGTRKVSEELDFQAPQIELKQDSNDVIGSGGLMISHQGLLVQADQGQLNLDSKNAELEGNILFSWPEGSVGCQSAIVNLDSESGEFDAADALIEEGQYKITAEKLFKLSETEYHFHDAAFSTCYCPDGSCPWEIRGSSMDAEEEGYGFVRHGRVNFHGVPILYSPYLLFPLKMERQSGLLVPQWGYSSEDGFQFTIPLFVVIDDHTDTLIRPFVESRTRYGSAFDFRKAFSKKSSLDSRILYSNESPRDGDLRGTVIDNIYDPTIDEDRYGGFYKQNWRNEPGSIVPLSYISDVHLVSDNLFLREMDDEDIGRYNQRYTISRMMLRSGFGDFLSGELSGEYNQALETDQDLTLQRLPDFQLDLRKSFRPFGYNPYGLKFASGIRTLYTEFDREVGYDGGRFDVYPTVRIPHHYKNYFNSELAFTYNHTTYNMNETAIPDDPEGDQITGDQRSVGTIKYSISTAVERVYDLDPDSWLISMTGLGYRNVNKRLKRVKHTIEPIVSYTYIPDEFQDDLPLYDSLDRIRQKRLFSYGIKTSLLGRFVPPRAAGEVMTELTPRVEDLPVIGTEQALADLDLPEIGDQTAGRINIRKGEVREIASLVLKQTYDQLEASENRDPERSPWSDLGAGLLFTPSQNFGFKFDTNYDIEDSLVNSWGIGSHFRDDRGDYIRARYTFIRDSVSQVEGNIELVLTEQLKAGWYSRYDDSEREFIENRAALRIISSCNCWYLDLGYRDRINPNKGEGFLTFTFKGLGDISQDISFGD